MGVKEFAANLTYGPDAANMLFLVVDERHRRHHAMIFTTNKSLKSWGRVLHDEDLAQARIDRELGRLLRHSMGRPCGRLLVNLDEAMQEESDQGQSWPEFPEPTAQKPEDYGRGPLTSESTMPPASSVISSVIAPALPANAANQRQKDEKRDSG